MHSRHKKIESAIKYGLCALSVAISGGALGYDSVVDRYDVPEDSMISVAIANCVLYKKDGRQYSEVVLLDRSHEDIAVPQEGTTCAQYMSDLLNAGAQVKAESRPCMEHSEFLPSGSKEQYRLCVAVLVATYYPH